MMRLPSALVAPFFIMLMLMVGCDAPNEVKLPNGQRVQIPSGATAEFELDEETGPGMIQNEGNAHGEGAGLTSSSENATQGFDYSAPRVWMPGGWGAEGGGGSIENSLEGASANEAVRSYSFWIGVAMIFAGGALWRYGRVQIARYCLAGGAAFIVMAFYPGLSVLLLIVALAVGFWPQIRAEIDRIRAEREAERVTEALRATVAGVEDMPHDGRQLVKAKIKAHASLEDTETIRAIKKADDLPSER